MRYHEKHKLTFETVGVTKTIVCLSDTEYELIRASRASSIADSKLLKARLVSLVEDLTFSEVTTKVDNIFSDHTAGQRQVLKDALHVLLFLAKKELRK
jgi:hypothetical protein